MPVFDRSVPTTYREVDTWAEGFGWLAHPNEDGIRASHAVQTGDDTVWLIDPLWAPGVLERVDRLGSVDGVVVCSAWHARDAGRIADDLEVPVTVPGSLDRIKRRIEGPTEAVTDRFVRTGFSVHTISPIPGWTEVVLYRDRDHTLYVPDALGTASHHCLPDEQIGLHPVARLNPPAWLAAFAPDRILVGHGEGIFSDATAALGTALDPSIRRRIRAVASVGPQAVRPMVAALRD